MDEKNFIPHIKNSLPKDVFTYQTSFYPVALEGWRRGLKLKYYNNKRGGGAPRNITYSLSDGEHEYKFLCARGSNTTEEAILKAKNKSTAYKYMKARGVPIPESKTFNFERSTFDEICDFGENTGYPLVAKPTSFGGGKGVITHINSRKELNTALNKLKNELKIRNVIIEKYFEGGVDYRFYVIEDEVIAVSKAYSSNVIGDGVSNLKQLIAMTNVEIKKQVASFKKVINIDKNMKEYLKDNNLTLEHIPRKGERIFLRRHGTYLKQRLNVACTHTVDSKFKKYAVDALASIPGLPTGSVDMIINEEKNEGVVNEINDKGEISMHVFPFEGQAVDVPKYLIDYYFPESIKINNNFYFEYQPVKELFLNGYADEMTIPMYPKGEQYKKVFIIEGERLGPIYLSKLKRKAASLYLKGNIKSSSKERVEIVIIGQKERVQKYETFINSRVTEKSKVHNIVTTDSIKFDGTSSIGIEIIKEY